MKKKNHFSSSFDLFLWVDIEKLFISDLLCAVITERKTEKSTLI